MSSSRYLATVKKSLVRTESLLGSEPLSPAREHWDRALSRITEMALGLDRIRDLVVKLKTFSHIDEGEFRRVSIRECVESVLTILGHRLRDRISMELSFGEPDGVECYPSLLNQALMNLVANSIDNTRSRSRRPRRPRRRASPIDSPGAARQLPLPRRDRPSARRPRAAGVWPAHASFDRWRPARRHVPS